MNLIEHLRQPGGRDLESPTAVRLTNLPWIGPLAYLHVFYKPADPSLVASAFEQLDFPASLGAFYATCNGLSLYAGTVRIFGCVAPGTLLNRSEPLSLPPLNLVEINLEVSDRHRFCVSIVQANELLVIEARIWGGNARHGRRSMIG